MIDLIKKTSEEGTQPFIDQVERLLGENTILKAEALNIGTTKYNLIDIDEDKTDETDVTDTTDGSDETDTTDGSDGTDSDGTDTTDGSEGSFINLSYGIVLLILLSFI